jgi:integrase
LARRVDSEEMIIRIVQSNGRKDRHVMLPAEILEPLRQWCKARAWRFLDAGELSVRTVSSLPASKNRHRRRHAKSWLDINEPPTDAAYSKTHE